jgi:hypothetical protein
MTAGPIQPSSGDTGTNSRERARGSATITENEDAIRNLKASQSVEAAFQAAGIPSPPGDVAAIITNQVRSAIQGLSLHQVANMSPGSGELATSAAAAVNQFVSSLTPSQREAVKAGVNPLDAAGMMKLGNGLRSDAGNFGRLSARDGTDSSARYEGMGTTGLNQMQMQARDIAIKSGLSWAANNPDLLRLGPSAIQALADVHLREDSYKRFKNDVGLDDKAIVNTARYAKRHNIDANQLSEDAAEVNKGLTPTERDEHRRALSNCVKPDQTPQQEQGSKQKFNDTMDRFKEHHPQMRDKIEHEQETLKTKRQDTVRNESTANVKDAKADAMLAALNGTNPAASTNQKPETSTTTTSSQAKPESAKPAKPTDRPAPKP